MRVCSVCGGEEFTLDTWECVTCPQRKREGWEVGARDAAGTAPDDDGEGEDSPGEGEPEDSPGEGEGEGGEGEGEGEPPQEDQLIVLTPGETIQLPDGTLAVVTLAPAAFLRRTELQRPPFKGGNWIVCVRLTDGKVERRMRDITQRERIDATTVEAGDFIFEGAKQEIVADTFSPNILDGCEYTVISLEDGSVHGLTVEQAQQVRKVEE